MARLGDAFILIRNGASIKQTEGAGGVPITRIETISNRDINRNKMGYAGISDVQKYSDYILQDNDILMSHINSEKHLGKAAIYHKENDEQIIHGMNLLMLRANKEIVWPQYAIYYFETPTFQQQIVPITKKSVNQASFTVTALKDVEIPLPELGEQKNVALIFDRLTNLIFLHKQQLAKLDELVKARFVEMFGDPLTNSHCWKRIAITDVCHSIYSGGTPSKSHPEYFEGTIPWVSPKDMKVLKLSNSADHITEEAIKNSSTNLVPPKSVLMVIRSGILKHSLPVAINTIPVTINQDMKAFVPSKTITAEYLMYYFKAIEADVLCGVRGVTADNIDFKEFQRRQIHVPPIMLQEKFSAFVEQTDKFTLTIQQSLAKLEILKRVLMQEYFG